MTAKVPSPSDEPPSGRPAAPPVERPMPAQRRIAFVAVPVAVLAALGALAASAMIQPFEVPEYHEIDTGESAFLIPLEGNTGNQAAFPSASFLEERKVAIKRIQVPHRWSQTGRLPSQGQWIPTVRLVKVDRRPITREWTRSSQSGTSHKDEAITTESRDSVNFSMGITCTACIPEDLCAAFLYTYPSKSLAEMMDMEVRGRVQQVVSEEAAKYDLITLVGKKNEIVSAVRADVVEFYKGRGIQITTVGMLGGITFENPEIQRAIDEGVKSQTLKVTAEARRDAQEVENRRIRMEAEARAAAVRLERQAEAEAEGLRTEALAKARLRSAEAEAEGIKKLAEARAYEIERATASSELYVRLRQLEAESERWKKWDGRFPTYWVGTAPSGPLGLLLPQDATGKATAQK